MKKLILLFLFSNVCLPLLGQNIKNKGIHIKFLQLPSKPLGQTYKTYSQKIELYPLSPDDSRSKVTAQLLKASSIQGYELMETGGDLEVLVSLEPFVFRKVETKNEERSDEQKDKTVYKYRVYYRVYEYSYPLKYSIKNVKKDIIIAEDYARLDFLGGQTSEYRSFDELKSAWDSKARDIKSSALDDATESLTKLLADRYAFVPTSMFYQINYLETKKENYDDVEAARDATQKAFEMMTSESGDIPEAHKEALTKAVGMWKDILKESNPEDKKARINRKVTVSILENIAFCYYVMHDFSNALATVQQSRGIDKQPWNAAMEDYVSKMKSRLTANGIPFN